ncbi:AAA family ATPase [Cystobacter fuscus]|uniref:AAA family ATPase n=1 Tax=Cystobacter fuscus TaxID=43 RepID=UPI002B288EC0|nr:AAA family ATPase [Cystobacter fuscus]
MITDIQFTGEHTTPLGLQPATLRELKSLVVLAGPNGAGKSRYLELVEKISGVVESARNDLEHKKNLLEMLEGSRDSPDKRHAIETIQSQIPGLQSTLQLIKQSGETALKTIPLTYNINIEYKSDSIVRRSGEYGRNPLTASPDSVDETVASNTAGGFNSALRSVYAYFFEVARAIHEAEHPRSREIEEVVQALADAKAFNKVLRALLNVEIEPALNANRRVVAQIRGRPFDPDELSKGELVLAVWAILLHRQKDWLKGACILIDEPENHLHPDVCIRALSALQKDIIGPDGQIWLATHSIPLIAHAGMDSVYFVDNGTITYAGNKIEKVIDRLMGGHEGRTKLRTFLSDAGEIAFDVFAAQCLLSPEVASAREKDPQQAQMVGIASNTGGHKENVRILDFSAGRGRFAAALKQAGLTANRPFTYYAFNDPRFSKQDEAQECLQHIRQLEQPGAPEQYLVDSLYKLTGPGSAPMDIVVMCNVLHEVPVEDWQRCFNDISDVLAKDGRLVILEDQLPNVGELPHENGYVILDELALQELFRSQEAVCPLHTEANARLTAFAITRSALKKVTPKSIGKALGKVLKRAHAEIRQIRAVEMSQRTYQLGRRHAHFTLLYANAQLALERYPEK